MIAVALAAVAGVAAADKADALFEKGKQQLAKKRYAEACATFEKVDGLDPGIGAKLNVARCYEEWGKLARAYRWYSDAEAMATETKDKRAPKIKELAEALDNDVPRLTVSASAGADLEAAAITLDGEPIAAGKLGKELRVDPGPHELAYRVKGAKKTKTLAIERGGAREVDLELPKKGEAGEPADGDSKPPPTDESKPPPDVPLAHPGRTRRIAGGALMGAGVIGLGIAGYLAFDARDTYNTALDAHCMGAKDMCSAEGLQLTGDARSRANVATVISIAGVALAAGGIVLYLTAPSSGKPESLSRTSYVAPYLGGGGGGFVVGGRY